MAAPERPGAAVVASGPRLLCTVSTVKDSRAGVERFVARNLAAGADHLFVLLEQDDGGVLASLAEHPHVTAVLTDERYWHGVVPGNLNLRQLVNADLVNTVLTLAPSVRWLVHLDGDECLDLERERLDALPEDVRCLQLAPLESVSKEHWDGEVDRFKRLLDAEDLSLLTALGAIEEPSNARYFRGHMMGKAGARPALDLALGIHRVRTRTGEALAHFGADDLRLLHYDSYSGEEFVRKWDARLSGGQAGSRAPRTLVRRAVSAIQRNPGLNPEQRRAYLRQVYQRLVADPVELLEDLGLLVTPDPALHAREPVPFPAEELALVEELLERLVTGPKQAFLARDEPGAVVTLLRELRDDVDLSAELARRLDAVLPEPGGDAEGEPVTEPQTSASGQGSA